eukprot:scaffold94341_cov129-Cyclotella_meneghiniana.AAC.1
MDGPGMGRVPGRGVTTASDDRHSKAKLNYDSNQLWAAISDEDTATTAALSDEEWSDDEEEENWEYMEDIALGLKPPTLWSGERVSGSNKAQHRRQNKLFRIEKQESQKEQSYWTKYEGKFKMPTEKKDELQQWKGS